MPNNPIPDTTIPGHPIPNAPIPDNPIPDDSAPGRPIIGAATALAPGTCGELVQGMTGGIDFLVTCPINQFSRVTVTLHPAGAGAGNYNAPGNDNANAPGDDNDNDNTPGNDNSNAAGNAPAPVYGVDHLPKTRQAVARALPEIARRAGLPPLAARVSVANPIPVGKGMGSSSADLAAAVWAAATAAGITLPPATIARIALSVEPTDGVMFPGIALFDHRRGRIARSLGPPPPLEVIIIDRGGQVDTLEFNQVDRTAQWNAVADQTAAALELVQEGIRRGDPALVGRAATISAHAATATVGIRATTAVSARPGHPPTASAHAGHLPTVGTHAGHPLIVSAHAGHPPAAAAEWLERACRVAEAAGAVGVNIAHSGTVLGILLDARQRRSKPAYRQAVAEFTDAASVEHFRVIGGGVRPAPPYPPTPPHPASPR